MRPVSESGWLLVHLVATASLASVGWTVQVVVYPAFHSLLQERSDQTSPQSCEPSWDWTSGASPSGC